MLKAFHNDHSAPVYTVRIDSEYETGSGIFPRERQTTYSVTYIELHIF